MAAGARRPRAAAALALALAAWSCAAHARVEMDVALGFSGRFALGEVTPLDVALRNAGSSARVRIEARHGAGDALLGTTHDAHYVQSLDLPAGARRRVQLLVRIEALATPLDVRVLRVDGGAELAARSLDLRSGFGPERLVAVIGEGAGLDRLNATGRDGVRVVYPLPDRLPRHWHALGGLSAIVVKDRSLEDLSAAQFEALRRWLAMGGTLAFAAGPRPSVARSPRLGTLLPALVEGSDVLDGSAALDADLPAPLAAEGRFALHRIGRVSGRVLIGAGGRPLVVERSYGHGRIVQLAFDPGRWPFRDWPRMSATWRTLLGLDARAAPAAPLRVDTDALRALLGARAIAGAARVEALGLVLLYVVLLATLRGMGFVAGARAHAIAVGCAGAFAVGAYALFGPLRHPGGPVLVESTTLEPLAGTPYARQRTDLALYSRDNGKLRLDYARGDPLPRPDVGDISLAARTMAHEWRYHGGATRAVEVPEAQRFRLQLLAAEHVVARVSNESYDAPSLRREGDAATLVVRGGLPAGVDGWLLDDERLYAVPADAPSVRTANGIGREAWRQRQPDQRTASLVLRRVLAERDRLQAPVLFAVTSSPFEVADRAETAWRHHGVALWLTSVQPAASGPTDVQEQL